MGCVLADRFLGGGTSGTFLESGLAGIVKAPLALSIRRTSFSEASLLVTAVFAIALTALSVALASFTISLVPFAVALASFTISLALLTV